ncbi:MAG: hypothetical protein JRI23_28295 [Deltaproteobacteria bacterium]|jgi:hypothetical protein|nr:hypothetical protein [Deltaproteobacteria bacterium]MBW2535999.1 hypothetical protein [Deltaproteobacteria bacterium]
MTRSEIVPAVTIAAACLGCGSSDDTATEPGPDAPPLTEFELPVSLPACDTSQSDVVLIEEESDFERINEEGVRVFCVTPGDYRGLGSIRLARNGTPEQPRVLRYYDPDDPADRRHPVDQAEAERALLGSMRLTGAQHWIVDGLTFTGDWERVLFERQPDEEWSVHNVLNRLLLESASIVIRDGCDDNAIQNSVIRNAPKTPGSDRVCVVLSGSNDGAPVAIHGTRVVNNEIYDCTDSIQAWRVDGSENAIDFGGTVIDNNDLYQTDGMYTDCSGNLDPDGDCSCGENAIDLKAAGSVPGGIVQVSNNRMWGFKPTDTACGGTGSGGAISVVHMTAEFTLYQGNVMWDGPRAMTFTTERHTAIDNVIWNIHRGDDDGTAIYPEGAHAEIYRNTIIDADRWVAAYGNEGDYRCNTLIDAGRHTAAGEGLQAEYNFYYGTDPWPEQGDHDVVHEQAADAAQTDLCFDVRPWTGPEQICIPTGKATEESPHAGGCDPELGSRPDVGIHDERW